MSYLINVFRGQSFLQFLLQKAGERKQYPGRGVIAIAPDPCVEFCSFYISAKQNNNSLKGGRECLRQRAAMKTAVALTFPGVINVPIDVSAHAR